MPPSSILLRASVFFGRWYDTHAHWLGCFLFVENRCWWGDLETYHTVVSLFWRHCWTLRFERAIQASSSIRKRASAVVSPLCTTVHIQHADSTAFDSQKVGQVQVVAAAAAAGQQSALVCPVAGRFDRFDAECLLPSRRTAHQVTQQVHETRTCQEFAEISVTRQKGFNDAPRSSKVHGGYCRFGHVIVQDGGRGRFHGRRIDPTEL